MSFSATLYNVSDDPKKIDKTLSNPTTIGTIVPTEECDILKPTFILNYNSSYTSNNYIVVDAPFSRNYFITDMKIDIGEKITISCEVDPLTTYASSIKEITTTIYRNSKYKDCSPYLPDSEYSIKSTFQQKTFPFTRSASDAAFSTNPGFYVLSWIGNARIDSNVYTLLSAQPSNWATNWGDYYFNGGTDTTPDWRPLTVLYPYEAPLWSDAVREIQGEYQSGIYQRAGGGE